jgi:hypothetical protein
VLHIMDLNVLPKSEIFLPISFDWILKNNKKVLLIYSKIYIYIFWFYFWFHT